MALRPSRPVLRYFGGKFRLAPWIIAHFPEHRHYVEPFAGAASVLLAKAPARLEVLNDLDGEIVNLFEVLRTPPRARRLRHLVERTPYARAEFEAAFSPHPDPIERARRLLVRAHMGFSNVGAHRKTGFSARGVPARSWASWPALIETVTRRLRDVVIERRPAVEIMQRYDGPETLHYVDPPYVLGARSHVARVYRHEMSDADHLALIDCLSALQGTVILSGYAHPLYDERLAGWQRHETPARNGVGAATTEVLWIRPGACR